MTTIVLKDVRLAFPHIFEPHEQSGKYNGLLILDPNTQADQLEELKAEIMKLVKEKWGGKITSPSQLKQFCLHDGAEKAQYDGFEGKMYVSASNTAAPSVVDTDGRTPLTKAAGKPYSGCYVYGYLELWAQDNKYGKGINATLRGVQFYRDGDAFGGGRPLGVDEFEQLEPANSPDDTGFGATGTDDGFFN
ncbi:MAG: ssDNA-binding protein [Candidatus Thiodiazotropha endolucinida]